MTVSPPAGTNAARRSAILDAAVPVFLRYGFKKTSMDDVARAAGISRQGLYLHFPNKELLFKEGLARLIDGMRAAGRAALARDDLPMEERLLGLFEAVHGHAIGEPGAENMTELLEAATALMGNAIDELEDGLVADLAKALRPTKLAAEWKALGISAKELADNLYATSHGAKHRVTSKAEYRDRMRVAIKIACRERHG